MLFSSVEIGKQIDKLVEDRAIVIEVDSFLPEGEDDGGWIGHREEALNDFKDMVTTTFFTPSVDPLKPAKPGWQDEIHAASQVGLLLATGGWGGVASFSYKKIDMTRIDKKSINLTMNERVTVRRSIYPQAHLAGLFQTLRDAQGSVDLSRWVKEVTLDDDWFKRRQVTAHALVNFDADSVEALNVSFNYGGAVETVRLSKDKPEDSRSWNSILDGGAMRRGVDYEYSVSFRDIDASERPGRISAPRQTTDSDEFEVAPQNEKLYFIDRIQIGAAGLPWDRYPNVEIQLRYADAAHGIDLDDSFVLTKDKPEITWNRFRMDEALDSYQIRRLFHAADNRDREIGWTELDQERFTIRNPVPMSRTVQVVPAVAWQLVSMVFVEMSYQDAENQLFHSETLFFMNTDQDRGPKTFAVDLVDETKRFVRYSAKILLIDNRQITIPPSDTQEAVVIIRSDMIGHRVIEVQSPQDDFAAKEVARIEVELAFADPGARPELRRPLQLRRAGAVAVLRVRLRRQRAQRLHAHHHRDPDQRHEPAPRARPDGREPAATSPELNPQAKRGRPMLQFAKEARVIEGVTVLSDNARKDLFWYLPGPDWQLARRDPGQAPQFTLISYRPAVADGGVKGGGFLSMEVVLKLDDATERKILAKLAGEAGGVPKLSPVPFDEGSVRIVALDLAGSGGTTADATPPGAFRAVETILGATVPSMAGEMNAVFSLVLSQEGAIILDQTFQQGGQPVGVIGELKYTGLQPALDVEISANYKRIYDHLSMGIDLTAGAPIGGVPVYLDVGIDLAFEKLKQDGVIQVKVINYSTDADKSDKEQWALDFFKNQLLADWFKPTLPPIKPITQGPATGGGATGGATSGGAASGGAASGGAASGGAASGGAASGGAASGGAASGGAASGGAASGGAASGGAASGGAASGTPPAGGGESPPAAARRRQVGLRAAERLRQVGPRAAARLRQVGLRAAARLPRAERRRARRAAPRPARGPSRQWRKPPGCAEPRGSRASWRPACRRLP